MLPKRHRITKEEEFKKVVNRGKLVGGELISLKVKKATGGEARVGFIVGKKVSKKAILRNKAKRRLRAAVARFIEKLKPGADVVVMPRADITKRNFKEIALEVEKIFKKSRLL